MPDFSTILSKPVTSAERPKPKAPGGYFGVVAKYELGESSQKKTPYVRYHLNQVSPGPEVDQEMNTQNGIDLSKYTPYFDYYLTDSAIFRLREFLESCGIPVDGRTFNETIPEAVGKPVLFEVENQTSNRPGKEAEVFSSIADMTGQVS